ncbi:START domain-containing protein [Psidium guajava]|nr:START domain-containing protein [Psidium guajava]
MAVGTGSGIVFSRQSAEDLWRSNAGGGWATAVALLLVLLWHCRRRLRLFSCFLFRSTSPSTSSSSSSSASPQIGGFSENAWEDDLRFLIRNLNESHCGEERWEDVVQKRNSLVSYSAKCCKPKDGPLKYLSVTVFEDCSPELARDFYMDNFYRQQWDRTVIEHVQLQLDTNNGTEIGRTIKKFPLLTAREYVLAWRLWEDSDGAFYCFTKECQHPSAPPQRKYVRVKYFRSGWRIRKIPGRNASEIRICYQEDAGLNVEMAKLVFAKGIWSYVCKMDSALRKYSLRRLQHGSSVSAVTFIQKVPRELQMSSRANSSSVAAAPSVRVETITEKKKLLRMPSKKALANGCLLLGGIICLTRGHSKLGAKVAIGYVLTKLSKRGASSSQRLQN